MLKIVLSRRKLKGHLSNVSNMRVRSALCGFLLLFSHEAASQPPASDNIQERIIFTAEALQSQRYDDAVKSAAPLVGFFPRESKAYELLVAALWGKQDFQGIIQTVILAEKNGVESSFLYSRAAEALFLIGWTEASLSALAKFEKAWRREHAGN